jgi:flagellar hook-associated protein 2
LKMQDNGTLSIDSGTLNDVLANHFSDLTAFLQGPDGFGKSLASTVQMLNSPTISPISLDLQTINQTNQYLTNEIRDFEDRLAGEQKTLLARYSAINASLQALPSLQNQLSSVLDSLGPLNSSK